MVGSSETDDEDGGIIWENIGFSENGGRKRE